MEAGVALQAHVVNNLLYLAERLKDLSGEVATAEAACKQHSSGGKSNEAISARKVLSGLTSERASLTTLKKLLHKDLILALGATARIMAVSLTMLEEDAALSLRRA